MLTIVCSTSLFGIFVCIDVRLPPTLFYTGMKLNHVRESPF